MRTFAGRAGGIQPQVGIQILDLLRIISLARRSIRQEKVGVRHFGIPEEGVASALFRFVWPVQPQKRHTQDDVTIGGVRIHLQPPPSYAFCVAWLTLQIIEVANAELRPGVPSSTQINCRLKSLHGFFVMTEVRLHDSLMIERFKVTGERSGGPRKVAQALYKLLFCQTQQSFSVFVFGFAGNHKFPC